MTSFFKKLFGTKERPTPIVKQETKAKLPDAYQKYLEQFYPENTTQILKDYYLKIVGVTHSNEDGTSRQQVIKRCKPRERLLLFPDPDNQFDNNAIKVCRLNGQQVGFIQEHQAPELRYILVDLKTRIDVTVEKITGHVPAGMNIHILEYETVKRPKKEKPTEKPYDLTIEIKKRLDDRWSQAIELENEGYIANAMEIYQTMIDKLYDSSSPYKKLSVYYRKQKEYDKEIAIIEQQIKLYKDPKSQDRSNIDKKIADLETRIKKAKALKEKRK